MRKLLLVLSVAATMAIFASCGNSETSAADSSSDLYPTCKPYTRWWWFSSDIDTNDVRNQLIWLKEHEFGGVEIAWIYPMFLDSNTVHHDFLSPEWAPARQMNMPAFQRKRPVFRYRLAVRSSGFSTKRLTSKNAVFVPESTRLPHSM